jgi:transcription antitermination factor NusG
MDAMVNASLDEMKWYALQTRSRHEKMVVRQLEERGVETFLPIVTETRRWSDRKKLVQFPLFPGYTFVHLVYAPEARLNVLRVDGVVGFVGMHGQGNPIPEEQIESVQAILKSDIAFAAHPYLKVGQRVRIRGGSLEGTEGIMFGKKSDGMLVISIDLIQRSLAIRLHGYDVEPA